MKATVESSNGGGLSVLEMFNRRVAKEHSKKHVPFAGTRNIGEKAKLYLNLEKAAAVSPLITLILSESSTRRAC